MNLRQDQNLLSSRRKKGVFLPAAFFLLLAAGGGAAVPHIAARRLPGPPAATQSDAIFVLAGGENRIAEGFRAWKEGKGKELFILGARGGTRIERILPGRREIPPEDMGRLHVEGWSENTMENAFSAKGLSEDRKFRQVILVTSDYHVPRAYFALRSVIQPGVGIYVIAVRSEWRDRNALPRTLRLFFVEGWKYWGYRLFLWTV
ncbi:MAG: YdcF family protein [Deltaproteobacteria bacterium]|nr:YdcF family protein [Deltaproteobacteria bacterium]